MPCCPRLSRGVSSAGEALSQAFQPNSSYLVLLGKVSDLYGRAASGVGPSGALGFSSQHSQEIEQSPYRAFVNA